MSSGEEEDTAKPESILKTVKAKNLLNPTEEHDISFFHDDTVDTVRQYIGAAANVHPDRLFITVTLNRESTYFKNDPRRWEALFKRMSYASNSVLQIPFQVYQSLVRSPATAIPFEDYGVEEWKHPTEALMPIYAPAEGFKDRLILGTEEALSYVLPYEYDTSLTSKIPAAAYPIPQKTALMNTLYPRIGDIEGFTYTIYDSAAETSKPVYFPFLQSTTPEQMPAANIQLLVDNKKRLSELMKLDVPKVKTTITRIQYKIPFVETDLGSAVRTRFEQMFYGITVSENIPSITLFTSSSETSRHKFYVKDSRSKTPQNLDRWKRWWALSKPVRARPTLVLYKGESTENFDQIVITSAKIVLSANRPKGVEADTDSIKDSLREWLLSFDAIVPFISTQDLSPERWEIQNMALSLKYRTKYTKPHLARFDCISSIFALTDAKKSAFQLLRTDHSVDGLSSMEVKVIQLIKEKTNITIADIQAEVGVSLEVARTLKTDVERHMSDNPNVLTRSFRGFPTMTFEENTATVRGVTNIALAVKYTNILRYILLNSEVSKLNKICPPRKEIVRPEAAIAPQKELEVNKELAAEYADMFADIEEDAPAGEEEVIPQDEEVEDKPFKELVQNAKRISTYGYYLDRLREFDPDMFPKIDSKYGKKCNKPFQPIILNSEKLASIDPKYDPTKRIVTEEWSPTKTYSNYDDVVVTDGTKKTYYKYYKSRETSESAHAKPDMDKTGKNDPKYPWSESNKYGLRALETENPNGVIICPEYWCMTDEIPLRKEDLDNERCPMCGGKILSDATNAKQDMIEFSVRARDSNIVWPVWTTNVSPKNGRMLPCCAKEPYSPTDKIEDKYYILSETKTNVPKYRCAFLPTKLMESLFIKETYQQFKGNIKRILAPHSGYFRVGMGRPFFESKEVEMDEKEGAKCTDNPKVKVVKSGPVETLPRLLGCFNVNGIPVCSRERVRVDRKKEQKAREKGEWYKIPRPRKSIDNLLGCSFVTTWKEMGDKNLEEIKNDPKFPKSENSDVLARIVSGIDEAFGKKELTALQELEYAARCLQCDVFRISMDTYTLSCMFHSQLARSRSRGIIVLQTGDELDVLTNVIRENESHIDCSDPNEITDFSFRSNIFLPPFTPSTHVEVEKLRNIACSTNIPSYTNALNAIQEILPSIESSQYEVLLDPFGRAQAFYVESKLLLPFQASPLPATSVPTRPKGYADILPPKYEDVRQYLLLANKHAKSDGYAWKEDLRNINGERVEIMLQSGLRIPVKPTPAETAGEPLEVIQTVQGLKEENLAFGEADAMLQEQYSDVSYVSEVFDFLMFELSKDIREKYPELLLALRKQQPNRPEVEPLLREWFDDATFGVDIQKADEFVTKVRAPCGSRKKNQCSGNVCGWDGDRCKIQVKTNLREGNLFNRIVSTLVSNAKIRGIVLDGRSTPFFSTVLYVELPHELIMTDNDLK